MQRHNVGGLSVRDHGTLMDRNACLNGSLRGLVTNALAYTQPLIAAFSTSWEVRGISPAVSVRSSMHCTILYTPVQCQYNTWVCGASYDTRSQQYRAVIRYVAVRITWNLLCRNTIMFRHRSMAKLAIFENSRWRTAAILKIVSSLYLSRGSSDFNEI